MIYFTRTAGGIPTTFALRSGGKPSAGANQLSTNSPDYRPPWPEERILVCVDDSGISEFEWQSPSNIISNASDNVSLMTFEQIEKVFEEQMFVRYAIGDTTEDDKMVEKCTYQIDRITLGLTKIDSKDTFDEYMLVPAWDFFGAIKYDYNMDNVIARMSEHDPNHAEENSKWYKDRNGVSASTGFHSFVTINAIDGSTIN